MKRLLLALCCFIFLCGCADRITIEKSEEGMVESTPEGIIPEDIDVPKAVLDAAINYTKEKFEYYNKYSGVQEYKDGEWVEMRQLGSFDNWRIEYLKPEEQFRGFEGYDLDVYSMNCEFHVTPGKEVETIAEPAKAGWVNYGVSTEACLVFDVSGGKEPAYMFSTLYYQLGTREESFEKDLSEALGFEVGNIKDWQSIYSG